MTNKNVYRKQQKHIWACMGMETIQRTNLILNTKDTSIIIFLVLSLGEDDYEKKFNHNV